MDSHVGTRSGPVDVLCLGCGDAFGSGGRLQSAFLIRHQGRCSMLDFGASSLIGLARAGVNPADVRTVVISHYHGDHYGGLPFLLRYRQLNRIRTPLTLVGPGGLEQRLEQALDAFFPPCGSGDIRELATLIEIPDAAPVEVEDMRIAGFAADHRPETNPMCLRIEIGGVTIGYTGDSTWNAGVEAVARGADLLIAEAYVHEPVDHHLSVAELEQHLPGLDCGRVVLTHASRMVLQRPPAIAGCTMAHDGLELSL